MSGQNPPVAEDKTPFSQDSHMHRNHGLSDSVPDSSPADTPFHDERQLKVFFQIRSERGATDNPL